MKKSPKIFSFQLTDEHSSGTLDSLSPAGSARHPRFVCLLSGSTYGTHKANPDRPIRRNDIIGLGTVATNANGLRWSDMQCCVSSHTKTVAKPACNCGSKLRAFWIRQRKFA
jgi:hypothetical protein